MRTNGPIDVVRDRSNDRCYDNDESKLAVITEAVETDMHDEFLECAVV